SLSPETLVFNAEKQDGTKAIVKATFMQGSSHLGTTVEFNDGEKMKEKIKIEEHPFNEKNRQKVYDMAAAHLSRRLNASVLPRLSAIPVTSIPAEPEKPSETPRFHH